MMALHEKSGDHQRHWDLTTGHHEFLSQISSQLSCFIHEQSGVSTNRHCHPSGIAASVTFNCDRDDSTIICYEGQSHSMHTILGQHYSAYGNILFDYEKCM